MRARRKYDGARGFTMLEMLVSMGIFLLICASAFTLLGVSQQKYQTESQVLTSFEEAQLGLDQIVRDVNDSGYPPLNQFQVPSRCRLHLRGYARSVESRIHRKYHRLVRCYCGGGTPTCYTPGPRWNVSGDEPHPAHSSQPGAIHSLQIGEYDAIPRRYSENRRTRSLHCISRHSLVPFVQNVMNNASPAQIAQINAAYPNMFPGGAPVPVFTYLFDTPYGPLPASDARSFSFNTPRNIRSIVITLIVQTPTPDPQTGRIRVVELTGRGSRINSFN